MDDGAMIATLAKRDDLTNGGGQRDCAAFRKSRRAADVTDDETWVDADHANTINAFDVGDTRTTHAIVGPASTLQANHSGGVRLDAESAAGGHLVPETFSVYPEGGNGDAIAFGHTQGIDIQASTKVTPTLRKNGGGGGVAQAVSSMRDDGVMPTLTKRCDGSPMPDGRGQRIVANRMTVRRLTPVECERLMGWPDGWTAPDGVKASDSKRYAACGDGIVAPVAFWIADRIRMIEEEEVS